MVSSKSSDRHHPQQQQVLHPPVYAWFPMQVDGEWFYNAPQVPEKDDDDADDRIVTPESTRDSDMGPPLLAHNHGTSKNVRTQSQKEPTTQIATINPAPASLTDPTTTTRTLQEPSVVSTTHEVDSRSSTPESHTTTTTSASSSSSSSSSSSASPPSPPKPTTPPPPPSLPHDLTVLICSGNLGNAEPTLDDLASWIPIQGRHMQDWNSNNNADSHNNNNQKTTTAVECFDIIAIGMQEATWNASKKQPSSTIHPNTSTSTTTNTASEPPPPLARSSTSLAFVKDTDLLRQSLATILGPDYVCQSAQQRGQMRLWIYVHGRQVAHISRIQTTCVNTGVAGVLANKGGIVTSLTYRETTQCTFCSVHLAAHAGSVYYTARCNDLQDIFQATTLPSNSVGTNNNNPPHSSNHNGVLSSSSPSMTSKQRPSRSCRSRHADSPIGSFLPSSPQGIDVTLTSHYTFLLGDLNFRTHFPTTDQATTSSNSSSTSNKKNSKDALSQVFSLIRNGDFQTLYYEHDELYAGMQNKDLLVDFCETLPCLFPPTFKVYRGVSGLVYKGKRIPSYTDRILYKSALASTATATTTSSSSSSTTTAVPPPTPPPQLIRPLLYEPCLDFSSSDHKPVRGAFALTSNAAVAAVAHQALRRRNHQRTTTTSTPAPGTTTTTTTIPRTRLRRPTCSYHFTFRNMSCTQLPVMDVTWSSDPYIMITWNYIRMFSNPSMNHSDQNNSNNVKSRPPKHQGVMKWSPGSNPAWPHTPYKSRTLCPRFEGSELSLCCNGPLVGTEAMMYVTVMDFDMVNRDDWIGTVPLNICHVLHQAARASVTAHTPTSTTRTLEFDVPLLKNAKYSNEARMQFTLDIEQSDLPVPIPMMTGRLSFSRSLPYSSSSSSMSSWLGPWMTRSKSSYNPFPSNSRWWNRTQAPRVPRTDTNTMTRAETTTGLSHPDKDHENFLPDTGVATVPTLHDHHHHDEPYESSSALTESKRRWYWPSFGKGGGGG